MSGRLQKHLGGGEEIVINGETFTFDSLGPKYFSKFMKIAKSFRGAKGKDDIEGMFKYVDDEAMELINEVVFQTVKNALPDEPDDDIEKFSSKYMAKILPVVVRLNGGDQEDDPQGRAKEKIEAIQRMKAKSDGPVATDNK